MTPFEPGEWPQPSRNDAARLWDFYHAMNSPRGGVEVSEEAERCERGEPLTIIDSSIAQRAYQVCQQRNLNRQFLAKQVLAAEYLQPPVRFATSKELLKFLQLRCANHALMMAHLAGQRQRFKESGITEFAKAVFLTKRLCQLPQDLAKDRLFLPLSELSQFGVSEEQMFQGHYDQNVRKLLWKQAVRIKDAYGSSLKLSHELDGWLKKRFRRGWLTGLYYLAVLERNKFDVWSKPVELSRLRKLQLQWQILVGRRGR